MQISFKKLMSDKAERLDQYLEVIDLPSKFRSYNTNKVYIRGLYFSEVEALSKFYDEDIEFEKQLSKLVTIFDDVIKGIDIREMEIPDFLISTAIANMLSFDNYSPPVVFKCRNLVEPNPEKEKLKQDIEKLESKLSELDDEEEINSLMEEVLELTAKMELLPDVAVCNTTLNKPISLEEIDFYSVITDIEDYIEVNGDKIKLKPVKVSDIIELEDFKRVKTEINEKVAKFALFIDNSYPIGYRYNLVSNLPISEINKLIEYDSKTDIKLKPIIRRCPKCGYHNKIYVSMNVFKVLP